MFAGTCLDGNLLSEVANVMLTAVTSWIHSRALHSDATLSVNVHLTSVAAARSDLVSNQFSSMNCIVSTEKLDSKQTQHYRSHATGFTERVCSNSVFLRRAKRLYSVRRGTLRLLVSRGRSGRSTRRPTEQQSKTPMDLRERSFIPTLGHPFRVDVVRDDTRGVRLSKPGRSRQHVLFCSVPVLELIPADYTLNTPRLFFALF
ncbi:hypothetical protein BaRGS_00020475 [Batillaria attramentaria]|uniref:Uncharacterized protein n=1 Tax=Batillaria attramentaria TaxID=370345 RepID=A0ABD0KN12_9CAEN